MKYIGNKTRLLDFIYSSMLDAGIPMKGVFCDAFGGTGAVGAFFKNKGFRVIANDIMTYSYIQQYVDIKLNKFPTFDGLQKRGFDDVFEYLNNLEPYEGYAFENYAPSGKYNRKYFSDENAKKIDCIRDKIEFWLQNKLLSEDEYYVLVYALINAADFVANISGTYGAYLKIWRSMALKNIVMKRPLITNNNEENDVFQMDANKLVKKVRSDVLYLDPPYNERQYASNFHVLESLAVWDKQKLKGITGQRNNEKQKSMFCLKKEAPKVFEDLIKNAESKYIILSYNNEGIIKQEEIIKILRHKGEVKEFKTDYRRFRTERNHEHRKYKDCDDKVVEHLYIVKCFNT